MISYIGRVLLGAAVCGALVFACTPTVGEDIVLVENRPPGPAFASPEGGAGVADASKVLGLCPSNECPSPLLTCPTSTYLCDVDPLTDDQNCGACGNVCAGLVTRLGGTFTCLNGKCELICSGDYGDCDGILDNGCETQLATDDACTSCTDKCNAPERCYPSPTRGCKECPLPGTAPTACGCKDLATDDTNCGACGVVCDEHPPGHDPAPPNSYYGCGDGTCNALKCDNRFRKTKWTDCNNDLHKTPTSTSDGCETDLAVPAMDQCGQCGVQCAASQVCAIRYNDLFGDFQCLCKPGETVCGMTEVGLLCADIDNDPGNCGACGRVCPPVLNNALMICRAGVCGFSCDDGWADCNDFGGDGCETNLLADPANCGACGRVCDGGASQACVTGRCAVEDCVENKPR